MCKLSATIRDGDPHKRAPKSEEKLTAAFPSGDQELAVAVRVHTDPFVRLAEAQRSVFVAVLGCPDAPRVLLVDQVFHVQTTHRQIASRRQAVSA